MTRSGYVDDYGSDEAYPNALWLYRGAVASSIRGKRGQALLRDLLAGLDALPVKELIADDLITPDGAVCALGAAALHRKVSVEDLDPEDAREVAKRFDIAEALAREVTFINDEARTRPETPAERYARVRAWVVQQLENPGYGG